MKKSEVRQMIKEIITEVWNDKWKIDMEKLDLKGLHKIIRSYPKGLHIVDMKFRRKDENNWKKAKKAGWPTWSYWVIAFSPEDDKYYLHDLSLVIGPRGPQLNGVEMPSEKSFTDLKSAKKYLKNTK